MFKIAAFILCTAGLLYISRASLRMPRSHGFYRFFAWEFIAALILLNLDVWFRDPFAWHQILSWLLLALCLVPLAFGIQALTIKGKPEKQRSGEPELLAFEKTTTLVTTGIYHYIRHPLYSSLLLLTWGVFFKLPSWPGALLGSSATLLLIATARADEAESTRFFGPSYRDYMKKTKMFVPFLF